MQPRPLRHVAFRSGLGDLEKIARLSKLARVKKLHGCFKTAELLGCIQPLRNGGGGIPGRNSALRLGRFCWFGSLWFTHAPFGSLCSRTLFLLRHNSPDTEVRVDLAFYTRPTMPRAT